MENQTHARRENKNTSYAGWATKRSSIRGQMRFNQSADTARCQLFGITLSKAEIIFLCHLAAAFSVLGYYCITQSLVDKSRQRTLGNVSRRIIYLINSMPKEST